MAHLDVAVAIVFFSSPHAGNALGFSLTSLGIRITQEAVPPSLALSKLPLTCPWYTYFTRPALTPCP